MENKYYTPSIQEFHVGFEFEYYDGEDKEYIVFNENCGYPLEIIKDWIIKERIRVKRLDQEDIEELGWKYDHDNFYDYDIFQMLVTPNPYNIQIFNNMAYYNGDKRSERIFWGIIKNKSELKKLMVQLGINE